MNTTRYTQTPAAPGSQAAMGLGEISPFVQFNSVADFQAKTGDPVPVPNVSFGPKHWADPQAATTMGVSPYATFTYMVVQNGSVAQISLPAYIAGSVNFFPGSYPAVGNGDQYTQMLVKASEQPPVPLPIRPLDPTKEHLQASTIPGSSNQTYLVIANVPSEAVQVAGGFTDTDRALLEAIATAVNAKAL